MPDLTGLTGDDADTVDPDGTATSSTTPSTNVLDYMTGAASTTGAPTTTGLPGGSTTPGASTTPGPTTTTAPAQMVEVLNLAMS